MYITAIVPADYTIDSLDRYFINGLYDRNQPVDVNKIRRFFLFNPYDVVMKTLKGNTQLDGFNRRLLMIQYNNHLPYISTHKHKDDSIDTFFYDVKSHIGTTAFKLIIGTKTLRTDVYAIGSK